MPGQQQTGDLLIRNGSADDLLSSAARKITIGVQDSGFSHVGIYAVPGGEQAVTEALPEKGVVAIPECRAAAAGNPIDADQGSSPPAAVG